jgi:hypothetical protein
MTQNISINNSIGDNFDLLTCPDDREIERAVTGIASWMKCRICNCVLAAQLPEVRYTICGCRSKCSHCHEKSPRCEICTTDPTVVNAVELIADDCSTCKNKKSYLAAAQRLWNAKNRVKRSVTNINLFKN